MTALLMLAGGVLITWMLRVAFITVVPAGRMPARVQRALADVAPSVMAAIVAVQLVGGHSVIHVRVIDLASAGIAAVVAWRTGNVGLTVVAGVVTYGLFSLV